MPNTLQELRLQRARIEAEIRAAESVDEKVGKVSAFIDEIGLGIEAAVAGLSERIRKKRSKRKWRYYQDPDSKAIWRATGPRPAWFKAKLQAGVPAESLLIKDPQSQ